MLFRSLSGDTLDEVRGQVELQLKALNLEQLNVGQLHTGGALAADLIAGGTSLDGLRKLKKEGLVGGFTLEVHPWTSKIALEHLRGGHGRDVIEGYSFYFNPLQRYALNDLFELIVKERRPILSIRTMAGGPADKQAARSANPEDFMQKRASELLPLYTKAGYMNWTDFSMNFIFSQPGVLCTIGSCSTPAHLDDYLTVLKQDKKPFNPELFKQISDLQTKWSQEKDVNAPDWSM